MVAAQGTHKEMKKRTDTLRPLMGLSERTAAPAAKAPQKSSKRVYDKQHAAELLARVQSKRGKK